MIRLTITSTGSVAGSSGKWKNCGPQRPNQHLAGTVGLRRWISVHWSSHCEGIMGHNSPMQSSAAGLSVQRQRCWRSLMLVYNQQLETYSWILYWKTPSLPCRSGMVMFPSSSFTNFWISDFTAVSPGVVRWGEKETWKRRGRWRWLDKKGLESRAKEWCQWKH